MNQIIDVYIKNNKYYNLYIKTDNTVHHEFPSTLNSISKLNLPGDLNSYIHNEYI